MHEGLLMRRGEAMRELGVGKHVFAEMIEMGLIRRRYARTGGRALFSRTEIEEAARNMEAGRRMRG